MAKHLEKSPEHSSEAETWFWWNSNLMCRWLGALLTPPFECFCPPKGQKLPKEDNQQRSRHSLFEWVYQIWSLCIIFKAMNANKWLWPIFGCKVGQSVQIGIKLELDVWHSNSNATATDVPESCSVKVKPKNNLKNDPEPPNNINETEERTRINDEGKTQKTNANLTRKAPGLDHGVSEKQARERRRHFGNK